MKYLLFFITCLTAFTGTYAQTNTDYDNIVLKESADYKKAEKTVLEAVDYLLNTPIDESKADRLKATRLIIRWMEGTPDYTFSIEATDIIVDNLDMMSLYMASMTKYSLENPADAKDTQKVKLNTWKILLGYCDNAAHHVKMSKKLKKLSDANKKGELEKAL